MAIKIQNNKNFDLESSVDKEFQDSYSVMLNDLYEYIKKKDLSSEEVKQLFNLIQKEMVQNRIEEEVLKLENTRQSLEEISNSISALLDLSVSSSSSGEEKLLRRMRSNTIELSWKRVGDYLNKAQNDFKKSISSDKLQFK